MNAKTALLCHVAFYCMLCTTPPYCPALAQPPNIAHFEPLSTDCQGPVVSHLYRARVSLLAA